MSYIIRNEGIADMSLFICHEVIYHIPVYNYQDCYSDITSQLHWSDSNSSVTLSDVFVIRRLLVIKDWTLNVRPSVPWSLPGLFKITFV